MNILKLIGCILLCELSGILGSIATATSVKSWYIHLIKPSFNPPGWLFGPVWTILYAIMGISLFIVWQKHAGSPDSTNAIRIFFLQLLFNAAWSFIFFGMKEVFFAFIELSILWILIIATIYYFWKISTVASLLLIPYLLWVTFAGILNYSIWMLNRDVI